MAWEEARGSSRTASATARQHAHSDDAKQRTDEASRLPVQSLRRRVLAGAGAAAVVLALVAFLALRGGDEGTRAALADTTPGPTPSAGDTGAAEPSPVDVLTESQPTGVWKLVVKGETQTTRGGTSSPLKQRDDPVEWTFPAAECSDAQCSGTITSSSGKSFDFTWDGSQLDVSLGSKSDRGTKAACFDTETGEEKPIEEAAARPTYHFSWGPFVGTADRLSTLSTTRTTYEWFGTCEPHADDVVKSTYRWVLTPLEVN